MFPSWDVTYRFPEASNANAVGRGASANLTIENPGGSSVPSNSTIEAGTVGSGVGESTNVGCGSIVSVERVTIVGVAAGVETVMPGLGRHATSNMQASNKIFFKRLS